MRGEGVGGTDWNCALGNGGHDLKGVSQVVPSCHSPFHTFFCEEAAPLLGLPGCPPTCVCVALKVGTVGVSTVQMLITETVGAAQISN